MVLSLVVTFTLVPRETAVSDIRDYFINSSWNPKSDLTPFGPAA